MSLMDRVVAAIAGTPAKTVHSPRDRRINIEVEKQYLKETAKKLKEGGFTHISTITVQDNVTSIEILYHLSDGGNVVNLRVNLDPQEKKIPSITEVYPGAVFYEQEVQELIGVEIENHPSMSRIILPESWPKDNYPLRKDNLRQEQEKKTEDTEKQPDKTEAV